MRDRPNEARANVGAPLPASRGSGRSSDRNACSRLGERGRPCGECQSERVNPDEAAFLTSPSHFTHNGRPRFCTRRPHCLVGGMPSCSPSNPLEGPMLSVSTISRWSCRLKCCYTPVADDGLIRSSPPDRLAIPLNKCRQKNFYLPWKCEDERHTYEKCQYDE